MDWKKLANKEIPAPLKPKLRNELDTSNFSDEFTKQLPTVSPSPAPANHERLFRGTIFLCSLTNLIVNLTKFLFCF